MIYYLLYDYNFHSNLPWSNIGANIITTKNCGIGTNNPQFTLDVNGNINFNGSLYQKGALVVSGITSNISSNITSNVIDGYYSNLIYSNAYNNASNYTYNTSNKLVDYNNLINKPTTNSQWTTGTGGAIYYNGGNVGIGSAIPSYKLDILGGDVKIKNTSSTWQTSLNFSSDDGNNNYSFNLGNSANTAIGTRAFGIYNGNSSTNNFMFVIKDGFTGIGAGTTNPTQILQIGNAGRLRISNGTTDYTLIGSIDTDGITNTRIVISGNTRTTYGGQIEYLTTNSASHIFYKY